jgi:hypothetical protein
MPANLRVSRSRVRRLVSEVNYEPPRVPAMRLGLPLDATYPLRVTIC